MSYDYQTFWAERGKEPVGRNEPRFKQHSLILPFFLDELEFKTVLEIGPGDGRITEMLLENYSIDKYDVIDISKDRLEMLKKTCPSVNKINANIVNYEITEKYDLVIAVETLLHIKPEDIENVMKKMIDASNRYIINIDYFPQKTEDQIVYYNFVHDYEPIYKKLGCRLRKRRIDQEMLYVATKD